MSIEFLVKEMYFGRCKKNKKLWWKPFILLFPRYLDSSYIGFCFFFYVCLFKLWLSRSLEVFMIWNIVSVGFWKSTSKLWWYLSFISLSSNAFTTYCYFFLFSHLFFGRPSILYHIVVFIQTSFYNNWVILIFIRIYCPSDFLIL